MARDSDIGSRLGQLVGNLVVVGVITVAISDGFHISKVLAFVILVGIFFCLLGIGKAVVSISAVIKRNKRCAHGVRRGKDGGCEECIAGEEQRRADEQRRQAEWQASHAVRERLKMIKKEAAALRNSERHALAQRWLSRSELYLQMDSKQFEDAVAALFCQLGYAVEQTPYSNDRGKDAIARKDGKTYLIECKRYSVDNTIGRRDLQIFVAAMKEEKAEAGFYINTGRFTKTAIEYAAKENIDLYDSERFPVLVNAAFPVREDISTAKVMCLECGSVVTLPVDETPTSGICENGHTVTNDITLARLLATSFAPLPVMSGPPTLPDIICDRCKSKMRLVNGRRGKFWGCSRYPKCNFTKRYEHA
jgi:ssDNA-binding Zn-finger/Zn-ribbon topoisomerase 1